MAAGDGSRPEGAASERASYASSGAIHSAAAHQEHGQWNIMMQVQTGEGAADSGSLASAQADRQQLAADVSCQHRWARVGCASSFVALAHSTS